MGVHRGHGQHHVAVPTAQCDVAHDAQVLGSGALLPGDLQHLPHACSGPPRCLGDDRYGHATGAVRHYPAHDLERALVLGGPRSPGSWCLRSIRQSHPLCGPDRGDRAHGPGPGPHRPARPGTAPTRPRLARTATHLELA
jgi:hypothetical protein